MSIKLGKQTQNSYKGIELKKMVGKTIEAINITQREEPFESENWEEQITLMFSDGTKHTFVYPIEV